MLFSETQLLKYAIAQYNSQNFNDAMVLFTQLCNSEDEEVKKQAKIYQDNISKVQAKPKEEKNKNFIRDQNNYKSFEYSKSHTGSELIDSDKTDSKSYFRNITN
ncbi:210_t:CDS:2 [Gigaspora margarita]|uniref:210_t:CDS:1 n=1 Tax=Gigaspora margarita TaxID=4874 RepID=A0ABN7UAC0_GIGMA|nr:210_t:CDS:2 [Gigaspora margarita]